MSSINKVILIGRLGRDPEVRTMQDGSDVVNLQVATSETWRDKNTGERKEKTEWTRVCVFDEQAVKVARAYLKKGSNAYIEGQLQTRKWTDQKGQEKYATEVVIQRFKGELVLMDPKPKDERQQREHAAYGSGNDLDDEIPF